MNKILTSAKTTACAVIGDNKANAILLARVELGKTIILQAKTRLKQVVPAPFKGFVDSKYSGLVIANAYTFAQKFYLPGNEKAALVADCVMKASALELGASFDLPNVINNHINSALGGINLESLGLGKGKDEAQTD